MPRVDPRNRADWLRARRVENRFGLELRKLARHIADLLRGLSDQPNTLVDALEKYAQTIEPWARAVSGRMLAEANLRDAQSWEQATRAMGYAMRREIRYAPTGQVMNRLQSEQVDLITSLPRDAALRAQELASDSRFTGARPQELAAEILKLGDVTKTRATLIARTESARASSTLTQARAEYIGSEGYIWRTAKDENVRDTHRRMEGKFIRWDSPPVIEAGVRPYHAGCIYNCRCYPEPVIPRRF